MYKIKLPRLEVACSKDDLRPAMQYIKINGTIATATDGHLLVRVDLKEYFSEEQLAPIDGKTIHRNLWDKLHNSTFIEFHSDRIFCLKDGVRVEYIIEESDDRYPDFPDMIRRQLNNGPVELSDIGFKPSLLDRAKRATGLGYYDHFYFKFYGDSKPIIIYSESFNGFALIMPVLLTSHKDIFEVAKQYFGE